jgi:hypothetical protein
MFLSKGPEQKRQAWWPLLGLLGIASLGLLAYLLAPSVNEFLRRSLPGFPGPSPTWNWITTGILLGIMVLLVAGIVAAAAPRRKSAVNEKDLIKSRTTMVNEKKARKLRQQEINKMGKSR